MRTITRHLLTIISAIIWFTGGLSAQDVNSLYFMKGIPQTYQINPSFQPDCNFFFSIPGLGPLQMKAGNSSFSPGDVFTYNSEIDSLITPFHPMGDKKAFLDLLKDRNMLDASVSTTLLSFGFRTQSETFITFGIAEREISDFTYPDDLIRLPVFGPDSAMTYDFNGLGINLSAFSQASLGISQKIGDRLTVGWRGKLLFGQANLSTRKFDFVFSSGEEAWPVHSNIVLDATLPFANIVYDNEGMIDFENSDIRDDLDQDIPSLVFNPRNFGLAMDLGVDYRLRDWLQLSASLVDFGKIKWKDAVYNLSNTADYEFRGVHVDPDDDDFLETFADSLDETFNNFTATENAYSTWLPSVVYAGAAFYPHPNISFGILSRTQFYQGDVRQQFTLSANLHPIRLLSTTFSYSVIDATYKNLGFGLGINAGPFNLYLISDTAPSEYFWPLEGRYINFKVGMNLVFGCHKRGKTYDLPLID